MDQGDKGYRYNRDSFLLADFFRSRNASLILDMGAGVGVVSILIGLENPASKILALEINPGLAALASGNARASGLKNYSVVAGDLMSASSMLGEKSFDAIVSNPPYKKAGSGRLCADTARAIARHEIKMNLDGLLANAARLLKNEGTLTISMLHERRSEYLDKLSSNGFHENRSRLIIPQPGGKPSVFLSEARLGCPAEAPVEEPPLVLRTLNGGDSEEFARIASRYV